MFQDFYTAYPRKIGKLDAERAWKQMLKQGHMPLDIISGARAYADLVRREGTAPTFVPYPASWLRAGRWMDENLQTQSVDMSPERLAELQDKTDRILRRGKYAPRIN